MKNRAIVTVMNRIMKKMRAFTRRYRTCRLVTMVMIRGGRSSTPQWIRGWVRTSIPSALPHSLPGGSTPRGRCVPRTVEGAARAHRHSDDAARVSPDDSPSDLSTAAGPYFASASFLTSAWPPKPQRIAERTLLPNSSSPREVKRE